GPSGSVMTDSFRAGNVARAYNHGENQPQPRLLPSERFDVSQANVHMIARHQVRDRRRENVWALFFHQGRPFALGLRRLVGAFSFLALFTQAAIHAVANTD